MYQSYYLFSENKALISCAVTTQLICAFVLAYAKSRFNGALLTAYLYLLNPYCYRTKKERTDPGTSMYRVDSELVKPLRGNLSKDSQVTAQARH